MLTDELARLERLQVLAHLYPGQWAAAVTPALGDWLFGVALGVAGKGMGQAALTLLDVLPGVDVGPGRRDLLAALVQG